MSDPWLEADEAAAQLGRTERQLLRYATSGRVRTRQQGRRKQYHRGDIEQLAGELDDTARSRPVNVSVDVGRALVEVVQAQRHVIELQREVMAIRQQLEQMRQREQQYRWIIGELRKRAK